MKKENALSVMKIFTMGMLMWGAHVLTPETASGASCLSCSWVSGDPTCSEPNPGGSGREGCTLVTIPGLGEECIYSGADCTASLAQ
jgi:hypothetical protein